MEHHPTGKVAMAHGLTALPGDLRTYDGSVVSFIELLYDVAGKHICMDVELDRFGEPERFRSATSAAEHPNMLLWSGRLT